MTASKCLRLAVALAACSAIIAFQTLPNMQPLGHSFVSRYAANKRSMQGSWRGLSWVEKRAGIYSGRDEDLDIKDQKWGMGDEPAQPEEGQQPAGEGAEDEEKYVSLRDMPMIDPPKTLLNTSWRIRTLITGLRDNDYHTKSKEKPKWVFPVDLYRDFTVGCYPTDHMIRGYEWTWSKRAGEQYLDFSVEIQDIPKLPNGKLMMSARITGANMDYPKYSTGIKMESGLMRMIVNVPYKYMGARLSEAVPKVVGIFKAEPIAHPYREGGAPPPPTVLDEKDPKYEEQKKLAEQKLLEKQQQEQAQQKDQEQQ
uniref:START domain-containing protein n=1 Tax=Fibrocapsa japonica TaxID=94617 RepID=A0A7S2UWF0_9STRA|mmetsp:Transcript_1688/g.2351  ORF Transcript_1688/g.2351 Transcript_1688/m.2351 type:complete len:311 (+) Transcript_1688:159-1091(+)|eukprot:CAMPEP_0113943332 /NCGR_PEP_ID=MMETSP1339-20121228/23190_1 /TAXON_ID=94617 /ORGANISM="Fibrocapsa japonica" /LENGTH=310 /DNA_ID=CAMNT_0000948175 /DNA_START=158 /DNA_END=1090 /DNA_ORIENTATION=+ /assembly_acc=CAM_ASM_000762